MRVETHHSIDWCHICGERSAPLVDVWYPENAEHGGHDSRYIRICAQCAQRLVQASNLRPD